jgi:hypothetical protein
MTWFSRIDGVYMVRMGSVVAIRIDGIALRRQYVESRSMSCATPVWGMVNEETSSEEGGGRRRHFVEYLSE